MPGSSARPTPTCHRRMAAVAPAPTATAPRWPGGSLPETPRRAAGKRAVGLERTSATVLLEREPLRACGQSLLTGELRTGPLAHCAGPCGLSSSVSSPSHEALQTAQPKSVPADSQPPPLPPPKLQAVFIPNDQLSDGGAGERQAAVTHLSAGPELGFAGRSGTALPGQRFRLSLTVHSMTVREGTRRHSPIVAVEESRLAIFH